MSLRAGNSTYGVPPKFLYDIEYSRISPRLLITFCIFFGCAALSILVDCCLQGSQQDVISKLRQHVRKIVNGIRTGSLKTNLLEGAHISFSVKPVSQLISDACPNTVKLFYLGRVSRPLGPNSLLQESHVEAMYAGAESPVMGEQVVLILKLALSLIACGFNSIDVEAFIVQAAYLFNLPTPHINVSHREMMVQFGEYQPHWVRCGRDLVMSGLADFAALRSFIIHREVDSAMALYVCDQLLARQLPYGWLIQMLAFVGISALSAMVAYNGSYWDMLGAAAISPAVLVGMKMGELLHVEHLELVIVTFCVGVWAPVVWFYMSNGEQQPCHITAQTVGTLLIHLPGCQIIWGALELAHGSIINGSTRMVNGMVQAMLMALFLCLGWQVWGRGWSQGSDVNLPLPGVSESALSALPPSKFCPTPWQHPATSGTPDYLVWEFKYTVLAVPLLILICVNLNVRVRDMPGPVLAGLCGLLVSGMQKYNFGSSMDSSGLPSSLQNIFTMFATANVAILYEILTGLNATVSMIPALVSERLHRTPEPSRANHLALCRHFRPHHKCLHQLSCPACAAQFVYAPGSGAMLSLIGTLRRQAGEAAYSQEGSPEAANISSLWESIALEAVTYMLGILLAETMWSSVLRLGKVPWLRIPEHIQIAGSKAEHTTDGSRRTDFTAPTPHAHRNTSSRRSCTSSHAAPASVPGLGLIHPAPDVHGIKGRALEQYRFHHSQEFAPEEGGQPRWSSAGRAEHVIIPPSMIPAEASGSSGGAGNGSGRSARHHSNGEAQDQAAREKVTDGGHVLQRVMGSASVNAGRSIISTASSS